eukprot:scaffold58865_cov27-Phaeocystis_antarctica.AAC.1
MGLGSGTGLEVHHHRHVLPQLAQLSLGLPLDAHAAEEGLRVGEAPGVIDSGQRAHNKRGGRSSSSWRSTWGEG